MSHSSAHRLWTTGKVVLVAAMIGLFANPAEAIDLSGSSGKYTLNLDVTVSWGARYRVQDIDTAIISPFEGGTAWSVNGDDGNLNYDTGIFSNVLKVTTEMDLRGKSSGAFVRFRAFYDYENEEGDRLRTPLSEEALKRVGSRADFRKFVNLEPINASAGRKHQKVAVCRSDEKVLNQILCSTGCHPLPALTSPCLTPVNV